MIAFFLRVCIKTFRPLLGPASCRFSIGCTEYALIQLQKKSLFKAFYLIITRILSCNPFTKF